MLITFPYSESGSTLYGVLRDWQGLCYRAGVWEAYDADNLAEYALAATAAGGGTYQITLPDLARGAYSLIVYYREGAVSRETDPAVWEDTVEVEGSTRAPVTSTGRLSLQDQIADDAEYLILSAANREDGFSEPVAYTAVAIGTPRTIEAVVEPVIDEQIDPLGDEEKQDRIKVFCRRHATEGIATPQIEDRLTRAGDARPYLFTGEIPEANQTAWVLIFSRHLRTGRGIRG